MIFLKKLEEHIKNLPFKPLGTGIEGLKLSLAGAQDKTAVLQVNNEILLPLQNNPDNTHYKSAIKGLKETIEKNIFV